MARMLGPPEQVWESPWEKEKGQQASWSEMRRPGRGSWVSVLGPSPGPSGGCRLRFWSRPTLRPHPRSTAQSEPRPVRNARPCAGLRAGHSTSEHGRGCSWVLGRGLAGGAEPGAQGEGSWPQGPEMDRQPWPLPG